MIIIELPCAHPDPGRADSELGSIVHNIQQSMQPTPRISSTNGFQRMTFIPTWRLCLINGIRLFFS